MALCLDRGSGASLRTAHTLLHLHSFLPSLGAPRGTSSHSFFHSFWLQVACSSIWYKLPLASHSTCYILYTETPKFSFGTVSLNPYSPAHGDALIAAAVSATPFCTTIRLWPFVTKPLETTRAVANGDSPGSRVSRPVVLILPRDVPASWATAAQWAHHPCQRLPDSLLGRAGPFPLHKANTAVDLSLLSAPMEPG